MTQLVIIRGCPGSGKTTYAREHYPSYKCFAADDFFEKNGKYIFNPRLLSENVINGNNCVTKSNSLPQEQTRQQLLTIEDALTILGEKNKEYNHCFKQIFSLEVNKKYKGNTPLKDYFNKKKHKYLLYFICYQYFIICYQ